MKNLKKIIATVLATTLIMSTNVFAATTTPTTYGEAYQAEMDAAKVPARVQELISIIVKEKGLTQANADVIEATAATIQSVVAGRPSSVVEADKASMAKIKLAAQDITGEFKLKLDDSVTGKFTILAGTKVLFTTERKELSGAQNIDQAKLHTALQSLLAVQEKGANTKLPGTDVKPDTTGTPGTSDNQTTIEKLIAIVDATILKIDADTTLTADQKTSAKSIAETLKKGLAAGKLSHADYLAAKAAIEALPDGATKTALLAELNYFSSTVTDADGNVVLNPDVLTTTTAAIATTPTTLAKTATNNGNVAVAGLAMIAVAGTVFFISKKKIA